MAYIGAEPQIGNYQICDAISVVNGQAAYTMQVSSTNVVPESANHMIVSLNGVIQKPGSSFTVSSSTITFASNLATGDSIDFIILLGNVLDLGVPSDSTVTTAKLGADAVTGAKIADDAIDSEHYTDGSIDTAHIADSQVTTAKIADTAITTAKITDANITTAKIAADAITAAKIADDAISEEHLDPTIITGLTALAEAPADTDEFLLSDAGTLKKIDYSYIKGTSDFVKLASAEISSSVSEVTIEGYFSSTYENYKLILNSVHPASTSSIGIQFKFGSSYSTGNYYWVWDGAQVINNGTVSSIDNGNFGADRVYIGGTSHTNQDWSGHSIVDIFQPYKSDRHQYIRSRFIGGNANSNTPFAVLDSGGIQYNSLDAVTGVKILMGSGNIESMDWALYGIKK